MISSLGYTYLTWLVVLCPILKVAFTEKEGADGKDAADFSCAVYSYTFKGPTMNCTWNAARTSPNNTQYSLYLKYYKEEEKECPHYIHDKRGRRIGCYFPNVTVDERKVNLTLKGSSNGTQFKAQKRNILLYTLEKNGPPQNITVTCHERSSECTVQWKAPPTSRGPFDWCIRYQIKDENRNTIESIGAGITSKNYSKNVRYKLRIRTDKESFCPLAKEFGEWSEPIELGNDPSFHLMHLLLAVLVTTLGILLLFCICKRCHMWQRLHGPIPQPKDIYLQCEKNVGKTWLDLLLTTDANEKITVVEEVNTNCKRHEPVP